MKDLALIHGWGTGSVAWEPVLPLLAQRFRVHLVALPGYDAPESRMDKQSTDGRLHNPHEQTSPEYMPCGSPIDAPSSDASTSGEEFVATAEALAQTLPEKCILGGWSLGAMLALQIARLAPQRVERLIVIGGTPSFTERPDWPDAQAPALLEAFCNAVGHDASATLQRFIALLNQGDTQARSIARTLTRRVLATPLPDTATLLAGLAWLRHVDLRQLIATIDTPALVIHGANDSLMPLPAARWLHATLPHSQLEIFNDAAHAPFLNDPERFARLIGDFSHASALD